MIRILQATCESRLFFYIHPTHIPTLSHLRPETTKTTEDTRGTFND